MSNTSSFLKLSFFSLGALLISTGCAIQKNRAGNMEFLIDDAEILGKVVQTFNMPDGSEARLRVLNGRYSIKLQKQLTLIPVDNAAQAEVKAAYQVGNRALILVGKSNPRCFYQSQLIAIQNQEVLNWDLGDCSHVPEARFYTDGATFDIRQDNGTTLRYTYQDGRLTRGSFNGPPPGSAIPNSAPRYVPGSPNAPEAGDKTSNTKNTAPKSTQNTEPKPTPKTSTTTRTPAPLKQLDFPNQEQKPIRIILDK